MKRVTIRALIYARFSDEYHVQSESGGLWKSTRVTKDFWLRLLHAMRARFWYLHNSEGSLEKWIFIR